MKNNVVLTGKNVYAEVISIDNEPLMDVNQIPYKRYAYQAIAFILREPAYTCFDKGDMAVLTLVPTNREEEIVDPETNEGTGQYATRDGWAYGGHLTHEQDLKLEVFDAKKDAVRRDAISRVLQDANLTAAASISAQAPPVTGYSVSRKTSGKPVEPVVGKQQ